MGRTAETGGNDVATHQAKHNNERSQQTAWTARQLRWDPGQARRRPPLAPLTQQSQKAAGPTRVATGLVLGCWVQGAGCRVQGVECMVHGAGCLLLAAWRCCMQVQGCKRPNRPSAGEMPGSTQSRGETHKDHLYPTQPSCPASQPVSGPEWSGEVEERVGGDKGGRGGLKGGGVQVEWSGLLCCYCTYAHYPGSMPSRYLLGSRYGPYCTFEPGCMLQSNLLGTAGEAGSPSCRSGSALCVLA